MVARAVHLPVLPVEVDAERRDRGVTVEEWLAAPPAPEYRRDCEDGLRPCPSLRCRHHVGKRGDGSFSCSLDFAELPADERTLEEVGRVLGKNDETVRLAEHRARDKFGVTANECAPELRRSR